MIIIKFFNSFANSTNTMNTFYNILNLKNDERYNKLYKFTDNEDYTHAIIINTAIINNLKIPKENIIGLAFEPIEFLNLTNEFIDWCNKNISKYYLGKKLNDVFINHYSFMWHLPINKYINISYNKTNNISIIFSEKNITSGHKYRWQLIQKILEENLDIDIYGRGCNFINKNILNTYKNFKGEFIEDEPYLNYKFHICIENVISDDYISEKFTNSIITNTIPIYLGANNANKYFGDSFINLSGNLNSDILLLKDILSNINNNIYNKNVNIGLNNLINGNASFINHILNLFNNNNNNNNLISVIIPTYNRFDSVIHSIKSVLNQTYKNIEIIVINDCSTDNRYYNKEIENLDLNVIKVIHLPVNLRKKYNVLAAQGKTKQEGIKIAKGEWIAFLDDDDYWMPTKLEIQLRYLEKNKDIKMCSTNMIYGYGMYDSNNHKNYKIYLKQKLPNIFDLDLILKENYINNSSVIIHKSIIEKVGEFNLYKNEDYDYWKRSLKYTNNYFVNLPLVYYDMGHGGNKNYN